MTIRRKIFLLAGILLALFGAVVGVLAVVQKLDSDEISNIAGYELPLTRLVAELDVDTDRYELGILRALRLDPRILQNWRRHLPPRSGSATNCAPMLMRQLH